MSLASVATVCLSMFLLAVMLLLALNLQYIAQNVESQVELVAYMTEDSTPAAQQLLLEKVRVLPGVSEARLVTKEQALNRLREQFGDQAELLDGIEQTNALRASLEIQVPKPDRVEQVASSIERMEGMSEVRYEKEVLEKLYRVTSAMRSAGMLLVLLLSIGTLILVANTVRLTVFARRHEIGIMKLVGATDSFIRLPFLIEGAILGIVGSLCAFLLIIWGYNGMVEAIKENLPFLPVVTDRTVLLRLAEVMIGFGLFIGVIGSGLSVRKFLRV